MKRRLVIVRPEPGNGQTIDRARALGHAAIAAPLFDLEPVAWRAPAAAQYVGVLLTSANAVRFAGQALADYHHLPCYAVGTATGDAARDAGFASIIVGDGDVTRLIARISTLGAHRLLHLSGEDVTPFAAHAIEMALRMLAGGTFPGLAILLAPVIESLLWPVVSVVLLHPQRRAPNPDENRPL